jgi:phosphatidylserine decarboxylase
VFAVLWLLLLYYHFYYFPRDPAREINAAARIVSPADRRVIYVKDVKDGMVPICVKKRREIPLNDIVKGYEQPDGGALVGIYLSPFDVHYQRSPISGVVKDISYHSAPSNHVMASMFWRNYLRIQPMYEKSPHIFDNERNIIHIANDEDDMYVVQIADRYINRIDCYVKVGDAVEKGQKIGMIRGGSQVDLFVVRGKAEEMTGARVGEQVYGGLTAIAMSEVQQAAGVASAIT